MKTFKSESASSATQSDSVRSFFEVNLWKKTRNSIFALINNIDTVNINYYPLHAFVSIWRIVQFIGPSLAAGYPRFWQPDSQYSTAISLISILFHIVPPSYRDESSIIIEFIYFGLFLICFFIIIFSSFSFRKNAKVGMITPQYMVIFTNGISHLFHPVAFQIAGESIGRIIYGTHHYSFDIEIAGVVLTFFTYILSIFHDKI
ncbi:hypothetical protein TRFO_30943 [Tritrichomonas foetus]|uniref:Uncharacterized protein n=1 Tax=Tritrichomonas foetus TaxID=1144522 RepID=A0A1J4JSE9_9EUKA|nr:hypothetical protein TRFO_30943 [Tritrichomonas foetus]|eukprot:OHT02063.1 hypothetical protein TRFO_30943 [Tritrichomonas foetus]